jgi:hypothetical protein
LERAESKYCLKKNRKNKKNYREEDSKKRKNSNREKGNMKRRKSKKKCKGLFLKTSLSYNKTIILAI